MESQEIPACKEMLVHRVPLDILVDLLQVLQEGEVHQAVRATLAIQVLRVILVRKGFKELFGMDTRMQI
jgi:hypothetical protein